MCESRINALPYPFGSNDCEDSCQSTAAIHLDPCGSKLSLIFLNSRECDLKPWPLHVGPSGGAAAVRPATPRTGDRVCFHLCVPGTADTEPDVFERDREARAERGERHARPFPYACRGSRSAEQPGRRERRGAALMGGRPPGLSLRRRTADSPARDKNCELRPLAQNKYQ